MSISTGEPTTETGSIFFNEYDREVVAENLAYDLNKTRNSLFIIGALLLLSDAIGLSMAHSLNGVTFLYILIVPALYVGLGFLAKQKPMLGMSIAALFFLLVMGYTAYVTGASSIFSGLLLKAVVIYFFIRGFMHARDAEEGKKKMRLFH